MCDYIVVHSVRVRTEFVPEVFGRLTTLGPAFLLRDGGRRNAYQVCECACGAQTVICVYRLQKGDTQSCGCLRREASGTPTHGRTRTPEYRTWADMKSRCDNANIVCNDLYGGQGIGYCDRWKKFSNFFADMGLRPSRLHTLDRFPDLNGNYEPSNCRWATPQEQANNRRTNRMITIGDKTDSLANWCRHYAMPYGLVRDRIVRHGWEPGIALTKPKKKC